MDEQLKAKMKDILQEKYGVDIDEAVCKFSTQNYAFIFPDKPYMIRVSMSPKKSRQEILSELLWVDDLKSFKETICEPNISLDGNFLEEFEIDGTVYRASMFRTARGNVITTPQITPMFLITVGDLLGNIHKASTNQREIGFKYKRKSIEDDFAALKEQSWQKADEKIREKILKYEEGLKNVDHSLGKYGLVHGDFHINNFFVEANNIWLFDFDGAQYASYMYDIAAFILDLFNKGYKTSDMRKSIQEEILPYFKIGYNLHMEDSEEFWKDLDFFLEYRILKAYLELCKIEGTPLAENLKPVIELYGSLARADEPLQAYSDMLKKQYEAEQKKAE